MSSIFLLESNLADNIFYWFEVLIDFGIELIPAVITALLTAWFLDKAFQKSKHLGDSLVKSGIDNIEYASGKMSKKDRAKLFGLNGKRMPDQISLCFLTGDNFFLDYYEYLLNLLNNNCQIRLLIANPFDSVRSNEYLENYPVDFSRETSLCKLKDKELLAKKYYEYNSYNAEAMSKLAYLERTFLMVSKENIERIAENKFGRSYSVLEEKEKQQVWFDRIGKTGDHVMQVMIVTKIVESLNKKSTGSKIELYYYKDEYRIPITLAKYKNKENDEYLLWTNMNAPVKETTKSVNVFGQTNDENDATYVTDVIKSFDYLFDRYSK